MNIFHFDFYEIQVVKLITWAFGYGCKHTTAGGVGGGALCTFTTCM